MAVSKCAACRFAEKAYSRTLFKLITFESSYYLAGLAPRGADRAWERESDWLGA